MSLNIQPIGASVLLLSPFSGCSQSQVAQMSFSCPDASLSSSMGFPKRRVNQDRPTISRRFKVNLIHVCSVQLNSKVIPLLPFLLEFSYILGGSPLWGLEPSSLRTSPPLPSMQTSQHRKLWTCLNLWDAVKCRPEVFLVFSSSASLLSTADQLTGHEATVTPLRSRSSIFGTAHLLTKFQHSVHCASNKGEPLGPPCSSLSWDFTQWLLEGWKLWAAEEESFSLPFHNTQLHGARMYGPDAFLWAATPSLLPGDSNNHSAEITNFVTVKKCLVIPLVYPGTLI